MPVTSGTRLPAFGGTIPTPAPTCCMGRSVDWKRPATRICRAVRSVSGRSARPVAAGGNQARAFRPPTQGRARVIAQRPVTMHRLLHHNDVVPQRAQRGISCRLLPELAERAEVLEILVAVQSDEIFSADGPRQKTAEFTQPRKVAFRVGE